MINHLSFALAQGELSSCTDGLWTHRLLIVISRLPQQIVDSYYLRYYYLNEYITFMVLPTKALAEYQLPLFCGNLQFQC